MQKLFHKTQPIQPDTKKQLGKHRDGDTQCERERQS